MLLHNGRQMDDVATLGAAGVCDGAMLSAVARMRGGGGDGGSTGAESRSCYLEMYAEKKPDKVRHWGGWGAAAKGTVGMEGQRGACCCALLLSSVQWLCCKEAG